MKIATKILELNNILNRNNEPHSSPRMWIYKGNDFTQVKEVQSTAKGYLRFLLY